MSGPTMYAYGLIEPDEQYKKMVKVWEACMAAEVTVPDEVSKFFNHDTPDSEGMRLDLGKAPIYRGYNLPKGVNLHSEEMEVGLIIDLTQIDPRIKKIKVINSY